MTEFVKPYLWVLMVKATNGEDDPPDYYFRTGVNLDACTQAGAMRYATAKLQLEYPGLEVEHIFQLSH